MGNKRHILAAAFLVAVLGALAWLAVLPREPVFEGKTLTFWLGEYGKSFLIIQGEIPASASELAEALRAPSQIAIQQIGTNALPILIRMLAVRDSALKRRILALIEKQSLISYPPYSEDEYHWLAVFGFGALGPVAEPAVPDLVKLLNDKDSDIRMAAASSLGAIGPRAHEAVPALIQCLTDQVKAVRWTSASALGNIRNEPALVIPALILELHQSPGNTVVNDAVLKSLGNFGAKAKLAVPDIISMLSDQLLLNRKAATNALKQIDPEAASRAGVE